MRLPLVGLLIALSLAWVGCRSRPLPDPINLMLPRADTGEAWAFPEHRGEALIVFFFTTWCVPCQAMEPFVAEAARRGAGVVGIALDVDGRRTIVPYVQATAPPYPVLIGGGSIARGESGFGKIPELPAVIFLDREGRPASALTGVADTDYLLRRLDEVSRR